MELIDNINRLLGDDLKRALKPGAHLKVAASCFSIYAFEALKAELEQVDELPQIVDRPSRRTSATSAKAAGCGWKTTGASSVRAGRR